MSIGYIGSKKSLINFIEESLEKHIENKKNITFSDLFAGTGFVGNFFNKEYGFNIVANDLEYYSYILNYALLKTSYNDNLKEIIENMNKMTYDIQYDDLVRRTYTPYGNCERMFFTVENGNIIDYIQGVIKHLLSQKKINKEEEIFLKASLLTSFDKCANTASVYGAYLKKFKKSASKKIIIKAVHKETKIVGENIVHNDDVLNLKVKTTIGYLDPPYNTRQYGGHYSQLNYILKYNEDIEIKGKTGLVKDWNRSSFCSKKTIKESLEKILENNEFEILMYSYNNEGLLTKEELIKIFGKKYKNVVLYEKEYKRYKSQVKNAKKNIVEYLFICDNN